MTNYSIMSSNRKALVREGIKVKVHGYVRPADYFPDIDELKFGFLFSRGDIEPYVEINDEFTEQFYGSTDNIKTVKHFTDLRGMKHIERAIAEGDDFDISTFTIAASPFFKSKSNVILTLKANVKAAFRSDIKSLALDNGSRALNLHRLEYPGEETNICPSLDVCDGTLKTSLWNEIIATPLEIVDIRRASDDDELLQEIEPFQKRMRAQHPRWKKRLIGMGGQKNSAPYNTKPSFKRSKSAPAGFGGS